MCWGGRGQGKHRLSKQSRRIFNLDWLDRVFVNSRKVDGLKSVFKDQERNRGKNYKVLWSGLCHTILANKIFSSISSHCSWFIGPGPGLRHGFCCCSCRLCDPLKQGHRINNTFVLCCNHFSSIWLIRNILIFFIFLNFISKPFKNPLYGRTLNLSACADVKTLKLHHKHPQPLPCLIWK